MCSTPTIAAALTPHIPAFVWITGMLSGAMAVFALGMLWQRRQDDKAFLGVVRYLKAHPLLRRGLEDLARETA